MSDGNDQLDQIEDQARRLLDDRMESVRTLAGARQHVHDQATALRTAQGADKDAYDAAVKAGWTPAELRKIGLAPLPKNGTRPRTPARGSTRRQRTANTSTDAGTDEADGGGSAEEQEGAR